MARRGARGALRGDLARGLARARRGTIRGRPDGARRSDGALARAGSLGATGLRAERPTTRRRCAEVAVALDGLPLAIELCAARAAVLSPGELRARVPDLFRLLGDGPRTGPGRQRTLAAALEWSWGLLDDAARSALAQCSVFAGGFVIESAERVLRVGDGASGASVLDAVQSLVEKSLVYRTALPGLRFGLLRSIRGYARGKLEALGEARATLDRHARHFIGEAARRAHALDSGQGYGDGAWLAIELDNLVSAYGHAVGPGVRRPDVGAPRARRARGARTRVSVARPARGTPRAPRRRARFARALRGRRARPAVLARLFEGRGRFRRGIGRENESFDDLDARGSTSLDARAIAGARRRCSTRRSRPSSSADASPRRFRRARPRTRSPRAS